MQKTTVLFITKGVGHDLDFATKQQQNCRSCPLIDQGVNVWSKLGQLEFCSWKSETWPRIVRSPGLLGAKSERKWRFLSRVRLSAAPGTIQTRILERAAFLFSRGSSQPRDWTQVSCTAGGFLTSWATREAQEYQSGSSRPRNWTGVSCIAGRFFTNWAMREAQVRSKLAH